MIELIETGEVQFGDPQTITVAELTVGDFVVAMAAQRGIRGFRPNSGIKTLTDVRWDRYRQSGRRQPPVGSRGVSFLSEGSYELPVDFTIIVRRRVQEI